MDVEEKLEVHEARVDVVVIITKVDELGGGSPPCCRMVDSLETLWVVV